MAEPDADRHSPPPRSRHDERWIDLVDPDEVTLRTLLPDDVLPSIPEHLLTDEPRWQDEPRARLESHGTYIYGVVPSPLSVEGEDPEYERIDIILTAEHLLTVRRTRSGRPTTDLSAVREAATAERSNSAWDLYLLLDEISERFLDLIDDLDERIDRLESDVEDDHADSVRGRIAELRHELLRLRRVIGPLRDAVRKVLDDRVELDDGDVPLFGREIEVRFADVYDKLLRATDGVDLSRDLLAGVRDYHQSQIANDQNEVMKRLTAIASMLLVPTLIVGVYGQNLKGMPEGTWSNGYAFSWALIVVTTIIQFVLFRRRKWF